MACDLKARRSEFNVVLNIPQNELGKDIYKIHEFDLQLRKWLDYGLGSSGVFYAMILHSKDTDDNGELKKVHWHIYLKLPNAKRGETIMNSITKAFVCINADFISIDHVFSAAASVQYLIHKNSPDKYHYDVKDIYTNYDVTYLTSLIEMNTSEPITAVYLYKLIDSGASDVELMFELGVYQYTQLTKSIYALRQMKLHSSQTWKDIAIKYLGEDYVKAKTKNL